MARSASGLPSFARHFVLGLFLLPSRSMRYGSPDRYAKPMEREVTNQNFGKAAFLYVYVTVYKHILALRLLREFEFEIFSFVLKNEES